jgi:methionyl-tRNA formyltransferase
MNWNEQRLKIHAARIAESKSRAANDNLVPGENLIIDEQPAVMTGDGIIIFDELQPAGKKSMAGRIFLLGARNWV